MIHAVEGKVEMCGTRVTIGALFIEDEIAAMLDLNDDDELPAGSYRLTVEAVDLTPKH